MVLLWLNTAPSFSSAKILNTKDHRFHEIQHSELHNLAVEPCRRPLEINCSGKYNYFLEINLKEWIIHDIWGFVLTVQPSPFRAVLILKI